MKAEELNYKQIIESEYDDERKRQLKYKLFRKVKFPIRKKITEYDEKQEHNEFVDELISLIIELSHENNSLKSSITSRVTFETREKRNELKKTIEEYKRKMCIMEDYEMKEFWSKSIEEEKNKLREERQQLYNSQKEFKEKIITTKNKVMESLDKEYIRYSDEYDMSNERNLGYLIGIKKTKKIIEESYCNLLDDGKPVRII